MAIDTLIFRDDTPVDRKDAKTSKVVEPYEYLTQLPGNNKSIRMVFIKGFNDLYFGIDNDELIVAMNELVDILHDCSLIIDDVEDSSEYRRGQVAAHLKFGVPTAINCVNYMYFVAIDKANKLSSLFTEDAAKQTEINAKVNKVITDEMLNLHHGQGIDIYWRDNKATLENLPTEDEYLEMVMDKTGGLLRLMVKLLGAFVPLKSPNSVALSSLLGIVYQLRDDYFNLTSDKYSHMKGTIGEDLIEGKFSFPILHSLRYSTTSPLYDLLYHNDTQQRKANVTLRNQAIEFMTTQSKSLNYTNLKLKKCLEMARNMIESDPRIEDSNPTLIYKIIDQLTDT